MIKLITFTDQRSGQIFVDYMAIQHIKLEITQEDDGYPLWLVDESQLFQVEQELSRYLKDPNNERYLSATWQAGPAKIQINQIKDSILPFFQAMNVGIVTLAIIIICTLVFLSMNIFSYSLTLYWLHFPDYHSSQSQQLWRYFTPAFLHFSLLHLVFNLIWWWIIGGMIEQYAGSKRLIEITLISMLVTNIAQNAFSGNYFGGLSGVVYSIVFYAWLYGRLTYRSQIRINNSILILFLFSLIAGFAGLFGSHIGNMAHLSGTIVGLLLAWWHSQVLVAKK